MLRLIIQNKTNNLQNLDFFIRQAKLALLKLNISQKLFF